MTNDGVDDRKVQRTRPRVWAKKIVLFKSIDPFVELRKPLEFGLGLNVIQGESKESSDEFETGHGIGKTTLCRLIRYCLGEKTYGQKHIVEEVRHCRPSAYVGAIIEVNGVEWSVLRSLGSRGKHFAKANTPLEELLNSDAPKAFTDFVDVLEMLALDGLAQRDVLSGSQKIQWLHILAMCSRDQESRYDRFWNWRHSRSESGSPRFAKPKVDAGLCLRIVLGLLDPSEPALRKKLEELEESLPEIRSQIAKKELEPSIRISQLRDTLAREFDIEDAAEADIESEELFNVSQATRLKLESLRKELSDIAEEIEPLDRQINYATSSLRELTEMAEQQAAASEATSEGNDVLLNNYEGQLKSIEGKLFNVCPAGRLFVRECAVVKERIKELQKDIAERRTESVPEVVDREQVAAKLSEQAKRQQAQIAKLEEQLRELNEKKNALLERRIVVNRSISRIPAISDELSNWHDIISGKVPNTELATLKDDEKTTETDIGTATDDLKEVVTNQADRSKKFAARFNGLVQRTINREFKGEFGIEEDGVKFRISRENSLAGEAYETLAVLLADIAVLMESASAEVRHPGLLIHDSPREADLNLRIYERLLEVAASSMQDALEGDDVPFQYIVTTTTPPSKQIKKSAITKHELSSGEGSLFGMQLEVAERTLFDDQPDDEGETS